jgi:hypothetical protein
MFFKKLSEFIFKASFLVVFFLRLNIGNGIV